MPFEVIEYFPLSAALIKVPAKESQDNAINELQILVESDQLKKQWWKSIEEFPQIKPQSSRYIDISSALKNLEQHFSRRLIIRKNNTANAIPADASLLLVALYAMENLNWTQATKAQLQELLVTSNARDDSIPG